MNSLSDNYRHSPISHRRRLMKATIILVPVMGFTWIIGLFAVGEEGKIFAYLFVIANVFQVSCGQYSQLLFSLWAIATMKNLFAGCSDLKVLANCYRILLWLCSNIHSVAADKHLGKECPTHNYFTVALLLTNWTPVDIYAQLWNHMRHFTLNPFSVKCDWASSTCSGALRTGMQLLRLIACLSFIRLNVWSMPASIN